MTKTDREIELEKKLDIAVNALNTVVNACDMKVPRNGLNPVGYEFVFINSIRNKAQEEIKGLSDGILFIAEYKEDKLMSYLEELQRENVKLKETLNQTKANGKYPDKISKFKSRIIGLYEENRILKEQVKELETAERVLRRCRKWIRGYSVCGVDAHARKDGILKEIDKLLATNKIQANNFDNIEMQATLGQIAEYGGLKLSCLETAGITTTGQLLTKTPCDLLHLPGFGKVSLAKLTGALAYFNLKLKEE